MLLQPLGLNMAVFPGALSNFVTGAGSATLLAAQHAATHNALEAKIGINGSADTNSIDYKLSHLLTANVTDLTASAAEINKLQVRHPLLQVQ